MHTQKLEVLPSTKNTLELMAFVVHEFRSQLNSIVGYASLLNEELNLDEDDPKAKLLSNIASAAYDIRERLKKLLEFAKLETSAFQLELETVDIYAMIYEIVNRLSSVIHLKNQTISKKLNSHLPTINGDSLRIEQILMNLLSNASQSTPNGGHISLSADLQDEFVFIRIHDGGPTIPAETQRYIFHPFCNPQNSKIDCTSTDLSLALCKHYVELHGGKIEIESTKNKGNTFSVILPVG